MSAVTRIGIALLLALASVIAPAQATETDKEFVAFLARWRDAITAHEADSVARMTQVPFLYEGRGHDREGMTRVVVPALLTSDIRRCLRTAPPLREDDRYVLACAPYLFYFGRVDGQWRWVEFAADGEG